MSQENIEVVRRFLLDDLDEALKYLDPDVVWNATEEPGVKEVDAVARAWRVGRTRGMSTR